jgi:hypothetical protein
LTNIGAGAVNSLENFKQIRDSVITLHIKSQA